MHEHGLTFSVLRRVISLTSKKDCECGLEELPNGLWVSLMTAILAVPMIGLLNIGFAWLRAPLTLDRNRAWLIGTPLDPEAMHRAAQALVAE